MTSPKETNTIRLHSAASPLANGEAQTSGEPEPSVMAIRRTEKPVTLMKGDKAMAGDCGVVGVGMVRSASDVKCGDLLHEAISVHADERPKN